METISNSFQLLFRASILSLFLMPFFLTGISAYGDETEFDPAPIAAGTLEGEVLEVEEKTLVIRKQNGEEVRVRMPGRTEESTETFKVGDQVEVYITPEGVTTSIHPLTDGFIR